MLEVHSQELLYFEDLQIGDEWTSPPRTVAQEDVFRFARLTGDCNPLHMDPEFARRTPFGRPIAHGLLGLSFMAGLSSTAPAVSTIALLRIVEWRFLHPIFFGDTIRVHTQVVAKRPCGRGRGEVRWRQKVLNQYDEVVQEGELETLVQSRRRAPR